MTVIARLLLIVTGLLAAPGLAQSGQTEISADRFVINEGASEATFSGSVVVVQPGLTVWADTVVVHYGEGGASDLKDFEAIGNVRIKQPDQTATGARARYNPNTKILRLTGDVVVVNASGTLRGPELVVDLANKITEFSGSTGSGRVTGVFTPGQ
jgi:lipopolysaccharide export system protein LptA